MNYKEKGEWKNKFENMLVQSRKVGIEPIDVIRILGRHGYKYTRWSNK